MPHHFPLLIRLYSNGRKALNDTKEMKLLLDMYKGVSKDQRDKVQLMATEKKLRSEIDEMRNQLKKIQVNNIEAPIYRKQGLFQYILI